MPKRGDKLSTEQIELLRQWIAEWAEWPENRKLSDRSLVDKPFARFIEEQIAGDVLWPDTADGMEAMGFVAAGPWDFIGHAELPETKTDGKIARIGLSMPLVV